MVSRWPVTLEARSDSRPFYVGFVVDKVALGRGYVRVLRFCPVSIAKSVIHNLGS